MHKSLQKFFIDYSCVLYACVDLLLEASKNPLMYQPAAVFHQPTISKQPLSLPVMFNQDEPIDDAFTKLSAFVTGLIQDVNFLSLQRACIEKAKSPKMLHKSNEIIPVIKEAQSFQILCSMLADTSYWNFLDIRMMEAMAIASMIPAAQETIENFKKTYYNMTLNEAAPYFPIIKVKPGYTTMHEDLDKDPSEMTIGELHKHRFYLETEVLKTGPDTCTICSIKIGSVTIAWQIHVDDVYQAYISIKEKNSQLALQAIRHISIHQAKFLEAKLPISLRGEKLEKIGPIIRVKPVVKQAHPLPKGYEWTFLGVEDIDEIIQIYDTHIFNTMPRKFLEWVVSHPQFKKEFLIGIKNTLHNKLIFFIYCVPLNINIGDRLVSMVYLMQESEWSVFENSDFEAKLWIAGCKETMRNLEKVGIFQAYMPIAGAMIFKAVITISYWNCLLEHCILPCKSPRTVGLRRITSKDVPRALALTNKYASQFEIAQIFQSEEEFAHWFLCPSIPDYITTFVVEDPISGDITDMFSFRLTSLSPELVAEVTTVIVTRSPAKQFITDLLVCVKQQQFYAVSFSPDVVKKLQLYDILSKMELINYCLLYNYQHPEVDEDNFCIFIK